MFRWILLVSALLAAASAAEWDEIVYQVYYETCWTLYPNRMTSNAKRVTGVKSLALCKKFCIAKSKNIKGKSSSCSGVEWDIPSQTCYAIVGRGAKPKLKGGRFHYARKNCKTQFEKVKIAEVKSSADQKVLKFTFLKQDWVVNLKKNNVLLGKGSEFNLVTAAGKNRAANIGPGKDCFWVGTAESGEQEFGIAAFSICEGRFRGYINTPINDYEINPYSSDSKKRSLRDLQFSETQKQTVMDMSSDLEKAKAEMRESYLADLQKRGDPTKAYGVELTELPPLPGRVTYYELHIIMDGSYFREMKKVSGMTKYRDGLFFIAELVNFMQAWYLAPSFGHRVWLIVKKASLLEGTIPINKNSRSEDELNAVCRWQANAFKKGEWDGTIFLTGDSTITNVNGLAIPFSACAKKHNQCGSIPSNGINLSAAVRTFSHEVAHTLGMLDLYTPGSPFYSMCFHGLMRDGASSNTWTRCSTQMYERWLSVGKKTCTTRENTPSFPAGSEPPIVPIDAAFRAKATMSSTFQNKEALFGAWKAVDGSYAGEPIDVDDNKAANSNPRFHSCAVSNKEKNPYILLELSPDDSKNPTYAVNIINYWEKANRLVNFEIRVGNDKDLTKNTLCYKHEGDLPVRSRGSMWSAKCQGQLAGRYVSLQILGDKAQISICELQVLQNVTPKNYKSPYKCKDVEPNCYGWIRGGTRCAKFATKCAFSCSKCKRAPYKAPTDYPAATAAKKTCEDQDAFLCGAFSSGDLCSTRRAILTCPKTCGKCGSTKLPPPPADEAEPSYDPNCLDKAMACKSWLKKNKDTCNQAHLAVMCKASCKKC